MTKDSGRMLFVADTTRERLNDPPSSLLVGELEIRGRVAPVPVWTVEQTPAEPEADAGVARSPDKPGR